MGKEYVKGQTSMNNVILELMEINETFQTVIWDMLEEAVENSVQDNGGPFDSTRDLERHISRNYI